ncbi:MAG: glycosyltransferase [Cyanobacteria bacterium P01_G01_bin.54]
MMKAAITAAFILPVRNRWLYTQAILQQLTTQISQADAPADYTLIVADDGSSDGTPEQIVERFPGVVLLRGTGDWWWTGAIAAGMDYALGQTTAQTLIWLNDDLELAPDFLAQLQQLCSSEDAQAAIVGGIVRDRHHPNWLVFSGLAQGRPVRQMTDFQDQAKIAADTLNGNIVVIPRQVAEQLGRPDVRRFPHYGGDYEYTERAKQVGVPLYLSQFLQGYADYTVADVVRYMPVWLQWRLAPTGAQKWQVLRALWTLKFHHNVRHIVNRMYIQQAQVPRWRYWLFYSKKVLQCLGSLRLSRPTLRSRLRAYCTEQCIPPHLLQQLEARL